MYFHAPTTTNPLLVQSIASPINESVASQEHDDGDDEGKSFEQETEEEEIDEQNDSFADNVPTNEAVLRAVVKTFKVWYGIVDMLVRLILNLMQRTTKQ